MEDTAHVAEHFFMGPTEIVICDDKCVSKEEAEEILVEIARRVRPHLEQQAREKAEKAKKEKTA